MTGNPDPSPKYSPLQRVVVLEERQPKPDNGGIIGEHGVINWRSLHFVDGSRFGLSRWLYVVHFLNTDAYGRIEESRLVPTGEVVPLASCLARDFEISYDRHGDGPDAVAGVFRVPGGFWNTFEFRISAVDEVSYEISVPVSLQSQGIARYCFKVPQAVLVDCQYIEGVMSQVFEAKAWRPVAGPESDWFC